MRKAVREDIREIMKIIKETIAEMRTYNNTQWDENYPQEKDFVNDIEKGDLYVAEREGKLAGFSGYNLVGEMSFLGKEKPFYCYEKLLNK